jgi:amino acid adenylation domain-containing protein
MTSVSTCRTAAGDDEDRAFWRETLTAGGATRLPRWTRAPRSGAGEHGLRLPGELAAAARELAADLGVPLDTVLLATHARVLAALSGEAEVTTGYAAGAGEPLPCRIATTTGSWSALVRAARRAEEDVLAHAGGPVAEVQQELGLEEPAFQSVFAPGGEAGAEHPDALLWVGARPGHELVLRVGYRTEALDAESAERIAGYHLAALASMVADRHADPARQSLLSTEEWRHQIHGLGGPRREVPDRRAHELFEERAALHPDAVAAVHGDQCWTYGELNARANRLAHALLARGLRSEDVVAVVTERDLAWLSTVLAVFKAGGAYLPVEPGFPPDRIARTLSRAGCRLALTEAGSDASLAQALESLHAVEALRIEDADAEGHAASDPKVPMAPGQLAYIYFTSGSTGQPKGAMCEHAGMLNHLRAKIDDLGIGEGQVVAQVAPQCFDISLWQLVSALLVGGRTLLVEQEVVLDVERFVDRIVEGGVSVLQVVPSYLEAVLSYLDRAPRALPDLRYVSVTGEAVKKELVERWFAACPGIRLVNAYGLTETSDDTNHEVMDAVPAGERVPLGRPVANVHVYVVDQELSPVPLGAPGEIVFSGVCVGRGYVNDPERSAQAFGADPHRPGERLYRSGDYGRWRPDGKLEFLGRRDSQVKVSGFRIEIGEIEGALLRVPGVRDGAVVVAERADGSKRLVAFYSAGQPLEAASLRERLGDGLPRYMIPSGFEWRERLPLTANGKIDRTTLTVLAAGVDGDEPTGDAPATPSERRVAGAWAQVLGIPEDQISRRDHFFDRGGTSLSAVKLAIRLDRVVSIKDVAAHPVLADLAALIDGRAKRGSGLLQRLWQPDGAPAGALICFPHAGGNAVNFQALAGALRGGPLAVYAVELPGHDLAATREPFAPLTRVVADVVEEVAELDPERIVLWGQSSGVALAVATGRALEGRGIGVERLFLGAQLLGDAAERRALVSELRRRSDADIAAALRAETAYTDLGELDGERAAHAAAAYRHDCVAACDYLADLIDHPPVTRLSAPVTVVVAADDPHAAGYERRYRDWGLVAAHVDLRELADGGHHFLRTRPDEAAGAVLSAVAAPAST